MGIMSKITVKPLLYVIAALALVIVGMGVKMRLDASAHAVRISAYSSALAKMTANRDQYRSLAEQRGERIQQVNGANRSNLTTIATLEDKLEQAVGQEQQTAAALAKAITERNAARSARDSALDKLRKDRETTYATDPTCADWGARPVCAAISDSLQLEWDQARQLPTDRDQNDRGQGEAARPDRRDPDRHGSDAPATGPDTSGSLRDTVQPPGGLLLERPSGLDAGAGAGRLRSTG